VERSVQARRWITALLLLGAVVPVVIWGGAWPFLTLACMVVLLCQWEFQRLSNLRSGRGRICLGMAVALSIPTAAMLGGERGLLAALVGSLLVWLMAEVVGRAKLDGVLHELGLRSIGYLYGAALPSYFVLLWKLPEGIHWLFLTLSITAVGDTAAYYGGSLWGRHKLAPRISPNKTVEGALAGLLGNVFGAQAYALILFPSQLSWEGVLLALIVGGVGQMGDLSESMLKRAVGLKDSSELLPGHGGVLDRLDSLLFAVPVVYYWAVPWR
jgi:phosphatidate cytidylyltransferase